MTQTGGQSWPTDQRSGLPPVRCISLRRDPLEVRKATLASILAKARPGIRFNEHIEGDGPTVFAHACKMGLEGVVPKRKDSAYRSGRSPDWLKMKNPAAPAVNREAEEDWGRVSRKDRTFLQHKSSPGQSIEPL
jgi:ATP dependent DNA ligase domain